MKKTVDVDDFIKEFKDYNREDNFSPSGLRLLFDYLEYLEEDIGEEIELDVIGFCCDFNELIFDEFIEEYSLDINDFVYNDEVINWEDIEEKELKEILQDYLEDRTSIVGFTDSSVIFQVF